MSLARLPRRWLSIALGAIVIIFALLLFMAHEAIDPASAHPPLTTLSLGHAAIPQPEARAASSPSATEDAADIALEPYRPDVDHHPATF
jgi:hypothetical protein